MRRASFDGRAPGQCQTTLARRVFFVHLRFSSAFIVDVPPRIRVTVARSLKQTFSRSATACVCKTLFPAVHRMDVSRRFGNILRAALTIAFRVGVPHFTRHRFQRPALAMGLRELAFVFFTPISELKKNTLCALVRSSPAAQVLRPCHFPRRKYFGDGLHIVSRRVRDK